MNPREKESRPMRLARVTLDIIAISLVVAIVFFAANARAENDVTRCANNRDYVSQTMQDYKILGEAKFEKTMLLIRLERAIPMIENPECKEFMWEYKTIFPKFKQKKTRLDKELKNK